MGAIVKAEASSHWYTREGKPDYEREKIRGGFRPTTLRDARKDGLLPSVTTITSVVDKPQLVAWKIEQGILAGIKIDQAPNEPAEVYARRVAQEASLISRQAASLGTDVHREIEAFLPSMTLPAEGWLPEDPRIKLIMQGFAHWAKRNMDHLIDQEIPFGHLRFGYGGRTDARFWNTHSERVLADWKTQSTKQGQKVRAYPEYGMQLAAYAEGLGEDNETRLWNVIVSTAEPGRIEVVDWTDRREELMNAFLNARDLWMFLKGYDPRQWEKNDG